MQNIGQGQERLERLEWLIEVFDKHLERHNEAFESLNRKATWTLATATGLAAASGFIKGTTVGDSVREASRWIWRLLLGQQADIQLLPLVIAALSVSFGLLYLLLLKHVLSVYSPKTIEYPVSPINEELGIVRSRYEDQGQFGTACWHDVMKRYVDCENTERYNKVIRGYIDTNIEASLTTKAMSDSLSKAFRLLHPLALISIIILFLA